MLKHLIFFLLLLEISLIAIFQTSIAFFVFFYIILDLRLLKDKHIVVSFA